MKVTSDENEAASKRAAARARKTPCAMSVHYDRRIDRVVIGLNTGIEVAFRPRGATGSLEDDR